MPAPRRTAVSYSRFSCLLQADGDSLDRQERMYRQFCERHNLTPGREVYADKGRSGYSGEHRTRGRLGQLIEAAKEGRFDPGTVIVIEAWDRLGRLRPDRQTELVAELLRTGVSVGVCRLDDVFTEDDFGSHKWTTLAVFIQLAHQESKQKAERVGASWEQRRKRARETGALVGSRMPAWIELKDGKPTLIPERAAVLQRIFRLAADGFGHARIVRTLTEDGTAAFGKRAVSEGRTRSQFSGAWSKSYVSLLLRDKRVIGEYQPYKGDKPDGEPVAGYFPAAVPVELFEAARAALGARLVVDSLGRKTGLKHGRYTNIFRGLLTHARPGGEGFVIHNKGTEAKPALMLISARGREGREARSYTFPYHLLERSVLNLLRELKVKDLLPADASAAPSRADELRVRLANLRNDLAALKTDLSKGYSRALSDVLRSTEEAEERAANDLQDELERTAKPLSRSWEELPTLADAIENAPDPEAARLKLRPLLRALVESGHMLIVKRGAWQAAVLQFHFVGGEQRSYFVAHRLAANQRPALYPPPHSFSGPRGKALDLRKAADVKTAERLALAVLDELRAG